MTDVADGSAMSAVTLVPQQRGMAVAKASVSLSDLDALDRRYSPVVEASHFVSALMREHDRMAAGRGSRAVMVVIDVQNIRSLLAAQPRVDGELVRQADVIATLEGEVARHTRPGDLVTILPCGAVAWLLPGEESEGVFARTRALLLATFSGTWQMGESHHRVVGCAGVLNLSDLCGALPDQHSDHHVLPALRSDRAPIVHPLPSLVPDLEVPVPATSATGIAQDYASDIGEVLVTAAQVALDASRLRRDLQPVAYDRNTMDDELIARLEESREWRAHRGITRSSSAAADAPVPSLAAGDPHSALTGGMVSTARSRWWARRSLSGSGRTATLAVVTTLLAFLVPWAVYTAAWVNGVNLAGVAFWVILYALLLTSGYLYVEGLRAVEPTELPAGRPGAPPTASAVIAAYLPNEADDIVAAVRHMLDVPYPGLQVVLAYNTPVRLEVEWELHALAAAEPRLVVLAVPDSTSKAQNVNAALELVTGEIVGIFDADHRPAADAFDRAGRWLTSGWDIVQGHCSIRNVTDSRVAGMVAAEFEVIYGVSHVGRSRLAGFGLFGGSNGYWRTQVLHAVRMNPTMLTEDIDSSVRAVLAGATIAYDRGLLSTELAPTTWTQLVGQRGRWSQGWAQVSKRWLPSLLRSPYLDRKQKFASVFLFGWREIHPWLAWQMFALLSWQVMTSNTGHWHPLPMWLLTTVLTLGVSMFQAYLGYTLGWRGVSTKRRRLFFRYAFANTFFYSEFRSTLTRIAHFREFLGERTWRITRRASGGAA